MLLHEFLSSTADRLPEKTALIFDKRSYSYSELARLSHNFATWLVKNGLKKNDRVAIFLGNCPETVIAIFGILEAGGCFVMVNPTIKQEKLTHMLNNSGAKFLITDKTKMKVVEEARRGTDHPIKEIYCASDKPVENKFEMIIADDDNETQWQKPIDQDIAAIIYTSGSTGEPKGVTLTHYNMVTVATSIEEYLENNEDDVIINMLALSFGYGLYQLMVTYKCGGTLVLERSFGYPYKVIELIREHKVTGVPGVPTMYAVLLQLEQLKTEPLHTVRYITNAAAALPTGFVDELQVIFPNAKIFAMYGQTECARVCYLPPELINEKKDSVGIAIPNTEVWIEDENGNKLPNGKTGELVVRGGHVMQGYWQDPRRTAEKLKSGLFPWENVLHTGDLFKIGEDGLLYFIARKDDIIKCRGEKVAPKEIENTIYSMPEVHSVRVIGIPHDLYGQAVKAEIVLHEGHELTIKDVRHYCKQHLEDIMVPEFVEFVPSLPMSPSGKIKRT